MNDLLHRDVQRARRKALFVFLSHPTDNQQPFTLDEIEVRHFCAKELCVRQFSVKREPKVLSAAVSLLIAIPATGNKLYLDTLKHAATVALLLTRDKRGIGEHHYSPAWQAAYAKLLNKTPEIINNILPHMDAPMGKSFITAARCALRDLGHSLETSPEATWLTKGLASAVMNACDVPQLATHAQYALAEAHLKRPDLFAPRPIMDRERYQTMRKIFAPNIV